MRQRQIALYSILLIMALVIAGCGGPQAGDLTGRVIDASGKAIGQAKVTLGETTVNTSVDGAYSLKGIPLGVHTLMVSVGGDVVNTSAVEIAAKSTTLDIVVAKGKVSGVLKDHLGKNVSGAAIEINKLATQTASGNAAGSFALDGVYYGTQLLSVKIDGVVVYTEPVIVDKPDVSVAVVLPSCLPGSDAPAGMTLVLCQDFREGDNLGAFGFSRESGWTIGEADGKRWATSPASGFTSTFINIPEMANANKVVVEYKTAFVTGSDIYGVNFLANEFSGGDLRRGGTGYLAASTSKGKQVNMRKITDNNYPPSTAGTDHHYLSTQFNVPDGSVVTLRFTYDHEGKLLDMTYNGQRAAGYPWSLPNDALVKGASHNKFILFARDTVARWTDIKIWVSK